MFIVLASMVLFGLPMNGSWLLLLLALSLYLAGALGLGLMISTIAESQQVAFQLAVLASFLPTMMLSGFVFPIASMPAPIQAITYVVPARYFIVALRAIVLKGAELSAFWTAARGARGLRGAHADARVEAPGEAMGMSARRIWFVMWKEVHRAAAGPAHLRHHLHRAGRAARHPRLRRDDRRAQRADRRRRRRSQLRQPGPDQPVHRLRHLRARRRRVGRARGRSLSGDGRRVDGAVDSAALRRERGGRTAGDAAGAWPTDRTRARRTSRWATRPTSSRDTRRISSSSARARAARRPAGGGGIEPRVRVWFNPTLESRYFMLPGIFALLLLVVTSNLSSMAIVREREIGTLEQLNVTPLGRLELILGKLLPYGVIGLIDVMIVLARHRVLVRGAAARQLLAAVRR